MEILEDLSKPVPARFIKSKVLKGNRISYIPWYNYVKLLDFFCPGWDWEVEVKSGAGRVIIEGRLIIRAMEGDFSRSATGTESNDTDSYGDPSSNAEAMALRRAAAKFGLGLALWEK